MVPPASHRVTRVRWYSGFTLSASDFAYRTFTFFGSHFHTYSAIFHFSLSVRNPRCKHLVWASPISLAATLGIEVSFFSYGYLDVSVPRVSLMQLLIHRMIPNHYFRCVPAFGYPWVFRCLLLTMAFRSLPRPSSAPIAKAFTLCSF